MRVLLTGGYGCIGCWIAKNLVARGDEVWVFDLREDLARIRQVMDESFVRQVRFVQGDVTDLAGLRAALEKHAITHVVHLAGLQVPVCRADPILGAKVNVVGTLVVFEAVRQLQPQVRRLVYASSAAVYGPMESYGLKAVRAWQSEGVTSSFGEPAHHLRLLAIDEREAPHPTTHYGVFKCCNEGNARIYYQDHRLSSVGLRPWTVYGVGRDFGMTSEPTKAIKCLALGRPYRISYGGWQDLQFTDDVAKTFIRCLEAPSEGAKSYNLRGQVVEMPELHRALCDVEPRAAELITYGEQQLPIAYDLSDVALERDLGPMPKTPLREGIRLTLERFCELQTVGRLDVTDLSL